MTSIVAPRPTSLLHRSAPKQTRVRSVDRWTRPQVLGSFGHRQKRNNALGFVTNVGGGGTRPPPFRKLALPSNNNNGDLQRRIKQKKLIENFQQIMRTLFGMSAEMLAALNTQNWSKFVELLFNASSNNMKRAVFIVLGDMPVNKQLYLISMDLLEIFINDIVIFTDEDRKKAQSILKLTKKAIGMTKFNETAGTLSKFFATNAKELKKRRQKTMGAYLKKMIPFEINMRTNGQKMVQNAYNKLAHFPKKQMLNTINQKASKSSIRMLK